MVDIVKIWCEMKFEIYIASRYLFSRKKQRFVSFITFVSVLGITIGVTALIVALSLINGFQKDVRDKLFQTSYHIMILKSFSKNIRNYKSIVKEIGKLKGIKSETPVLYTNVLLKYGAETTGGIIKGIPEELIGKEWSKFIEEGKIGKDENSVYIGKEIADKLGVGVDDRIRVFFPSFNLSPFGALPKSKYLKVGGIIKTGLYEFDSVSILIELKKLQKILKSGDSVNYIGVKIEKIFEAENLKKRIEKILGPAFYIVTWQELNKPLFSALKLEKTVMFFTIALIVFVAALNIIATLILLVIEKVKDIGILSSLGATPDNIRNIFFYQGSIIGILGTFSGLILGLFIVFISNTFKLIRVPEEIYHVGFITFRPQLDDILIIVVASLLITFLTTIYPSKKAAEIEPAEALREE